MDFTKLAKIFRSTKKPTVKAEYDFHKSTNAAGGRKRRQAVVEKHDEERVLPSYQRYEAINLGRDMVRNNPQIRGLAKIMRANVVGDAGKLRFNATGNLWYTQAEHYFNSTWGRHADYVDGTSWRELLQLAIYSLAIEGDFLLIFDDGILSGSPEGTGRLCVFESDQICNLRKEDFAEYATRGYEQHNGIVTRYGRKVGIIATHKRGLDVVAKEDALCLICETAEEFEGAPWKHVTRKYRQRQLRGVGDVVAALQGAIDGYEMLGYELQSAKLAASHYAFVKDGATESAGEYLPAGYVDEDEPNTDDPGAEGGEALNAVAECDDEWRARGLERYMGGGVDYIPNDADIVFDPTARPNTNLPAFLGYIQDQSGMSFGLPHAYAALRADSSYTAYRGDMLQAWQVFRDLQQYCEDAFSDWVAIHVIERAIAVGDLPQGPDGWRDVIAWTYPQMPQIDPSKEAAANEQRLRLGLTTYAEILGPDWEGKLVQAAREKAKMHELGLTHPQDEGAEITTYEDNEEGAEDGEEN